MGKCEQQPIRVHEGTSSGAFDFRQAMAQQRRIEASFARDKYGGWYPNHRAQKPIVRK